MLASDVSACRAYVGQFDGLPDHQGACDHIDLSGAQTIMLEAGRAYRSDVTLVHESLPVIEACLRTLVRLNIPQ